MHSRIIMTHPYPLDAPGGGTRSCLQIAQHLAALGAEVILVPVASEPTEPLLDKPVKQIIPALPSKFHYLFDGLSVAKIVQKIVLEKPVDAVLSWGYEAAFLNQFIQSENVIFGMIAAHPSYEEWVNRKTSFYAVKSLVDEWFRWRPFKQANIVFVSSKFTQQELTALFQIRPEQIIITHRGIDAVFSKVERVVGENVSNLIFYGSFAPIKGVFDTISALGQVAAQGHRNWKLKLAGWGNEASVMQAIHEHGIDDQVLLLGRLSPDELVRELEWAHLALLPSQAESFGRSIAEAQAAGLPVISYNTGSIPEIVEHGITGWLAPPKQTDRLADAVIEAIQNPQRTFQMGLAGRERVTQQFSWEKTAKAILEGIEDAKRRLV